MEKAKFTVYGEPKGKGRPVFVLNLGLPFPFGSPYTVNFAFSISASY